MALMALLEMPLMFSRTIKYRSQKISHNLPVLIQIPLKFLFIYLFIYFVNPFLNKAKGGKRKEGTERERKRERERDLFTLIQVGWVLLTLGRENTIRVLTFNPNLKALG
jgi:hypothetical protein